jgi:hypothetical protein
MGVTDTAKNTFSVNSSNSATLDQDTGETPTLSFVNTLVGSAGAKTVSFTVGGIDPADDTAVITFKDQNGKTTAATVTANGTAMADLSGLADGIITASMGVTDTAKNTFSVNSSNSATLDQDTGEQKLLKLTVASPAVNAATAPALAFTVAGLDAEDTGTVTFTDTNGKMVQVSVKGTQTNYTADLSSLADGAIISSLTVNPDTAGNSFNPVSGIPATLTQIDHWNNTAGGDWAKTSLNWTTWNGQAFPTGTIGAYIDASGTYKVAITTSGPTAPTAYALVVNDIGGTATVSDMSGGTLSLWGPGGSTNPNGKLTVTSGVFTLAGGMLNSGAISILPAAGGNVGGTLNISASYVLLPQSITDNGSLNIGANVTFAGAINGSGAINVQKGTMATFSGALSGSETITNKGSVTISGNATLSGAISGNGQFFLSNGGSLEFVGADSENVTFNSATGTLKIDNSTTPGGAFTGQLAGLSTQGTNFVDLADLTWNPNPGKMTWSYATTKSGSTLTVSNGTKTVNLNLATANYASFKLSQDSGTGTLIADPPVIGSLTPNPDGGADGTIDLSDISFGADTTLGYSANSDHTGGTLTVSDGFHAQSVALVGQYVVSSFVMTRDGHGGTFVTDPPPNQQQFLSQPHA